MDDKVAGWLFFNLEGTKTIFVGDKLEVEQRHEFDWDLLLEEGCRNDFVKHFKARPTKDSPLKGYRIDAPVAEVAAWLNACRRKNEARKK